MFDGKAFGAEIVGVVKDYMERSLAPVVARVEAIERRISEMPVPKDGKDADIEEIKAFIEGRMGEQIKFVLADFQPKDGRDGIDGKDGAPGERGADGEPGERGEPGLTGKDGAPGMNGRDGLDAVEFLRGADGHLVVTLSNGTTRDLGEINGKDGAPGLNGKDGADGLGFDDLDVVETETGFVLRFVKGEVVKEYRLPIPLYRGVWKEGGTYRRGDGVTWGGALWIAEDDETTDKPDGGKGWRLAVKKGRDGKDGKSGPSTPPIVKV